VVSILHTSITSPKTAMFGKSSLDRHVALEAGDTGVLGKEKDPRV
jgi:hypothetical protein